MELFGKHSYVNLIIVKQIFLLICYKIIRLKINLLFCLLYMDNKDHKSFNL